MDLPALLAMAGLAAALGAALVALRRRAAEMDALVAAAAAVAPQPASGTLPGEPTADIDDSLPVGVIRFGADRRVVRANERAHAILGAAPGRLIGRTMMEAFLDARAEAYILGADAASAASSGALSEAALELRLGDPEPSPVVLRVDRRSAASPVVILEDVGELRRLQQIRREFVDNLSHELRTPLTTVSLLAETLARDAERADVPAKMRDRIAKIEIETGHLVQMVGELLDLARIEGGSPLRLTDDVDLGRLAEASVERLRPFAERGGITLVVDADPAAPHVRGDEARLGQVLVNLVHNAVKFSHDGGTVRISVHPEDGGESAGVAVEDHGIGIARADRPRVFERFYKVDRARVRGGGTGLGLAIARHVIAGHGGRIGVESEEGKGSTFWFTIPSGTSAPLPTQSPPSSHPVADQ
jgi:two-component system phosphate regulon sensor histidine kinase PhoR